MASAPHPAPSHRCTVAACAPPTATARAPQARLLRWVAIGPRSRRRLALVLVLLAVLLSGCEGYLGDIAGEGERGKAPAGLATSEAQRASWPDPPADAVPAEVQRVADGDTFVAAVEGRRERIRVIGVDTPESVDPNRPDEPFGEESSDFAKRYLGGETVLLAGDAEPRDRYGRMLAYVWLADGTFWNALLVAEGYAQQLTIPPNVTYAGLFLRLVGEARSDNRGLWAAENHGSS